MGNVLWNIVKMNDYDSKMQEESQINLYVSFLLHVYTSRSALFLVVYHLYEILSAQSPDKRALVCSPCHNVTVAAVVGDSDSDLPSHGFFPSGSGYLICTEHFRWFSSGHRYL